MLFCSLEPSSSGPRVFSCHHESLTTPAQNLDLAHAKCTASGSIRRLSRYKWRDLIGAHQNHEPQGYFWGQPMGQAVLLLCAWISTSVGKVRRPGLGSDRFPRTLVNGHRRPGG